MAPLCSSWMWKVLPRCAREITSRRFRKQIIAWRKDYGRTAIRFVLIVTVAVFAAANVVASKRQSAAGPDYSPMRVARKQRSIGWLTASCSPTWHNVNAWAVATDGPDLLIWERSWRFRCTAIATSFHMERLPTGALRSRAKPSWRSAPAPTHSPLCYWRCLSTATKSSLTLPLKNTCPSATRSGRSS